MPRKINKQERKEIIVKAALEVFEKEGYRDANLSTIAELSGVNRPLIYNILGDKNAIFYYAVKIVTDKMFKRYSTMAWDESLGDDIKRIEIIIDDVLDFAASNDTALANLLEFMLTEKKRGVEFEEIIDNRTVKLQILLKRLIRDGIRTGTIKKCNYSELAKNLFNLLESICFQVAFFKTYDLASAKKLIHSYLDFFKA